MAAEVMMASWFDDDEALFEVVVNHEEQHSIWPVGRPVPAGWRTVGKTGTRQECLAHIDEVWIDMRPLSLRESSDTE
jgi:MbtH protein